jgi:hypothetical protein
MYAKEKNTNSFFVVPTITVTVDKTWYCCYEVGSSCYSVA